MRTDLPQEACLWCSALSPLHPILTFQPSPSPSCHGLLTHSGHCHRLRKPSSTPSPLGPGLLQEAGQGQEAQVTPLFHQLNCSQTRLGVQLEGGCNHHESA